MGIGACRWGLIALGLVVAGCDSLGVDRAGVPGAAETEELAAILETVELTYAVSSFNDAATADPEEFRRPFAPGATLAFTRDGQLVERTVDEYVAIRRDLLETGEVQSLEEWELAGETEFFGDVAQRMSSYAVRINGSEDIVERGVMSFQLVKIGGEWKVQSLTWQAESPQLPLPARFLPPS